MVYKNNVLPGLVKFKTKFFVRVLLQLTVCNQRGVRTFLSTTAGP